VVFQKKDGRRNVLLHPDASHAPFISHREDFVKQLVSIARQQRNRNIMQKQRL